MSRPAFTVGQRVRLKLAEDSTFNGREGTIDAILDGVHYVRLRLTDAASADIACFADELRPVKESKPSAA